MRPLHPLLPTPVGRVFAGVLGPTRGRGANVGNSPPFLFWGHIPQTPWEGACAPSTPFCPPPLAEGSPAYWVPLVAGGLMWATRPPFLFWGHIPQTPWEGACAPSTPRLPTLAGLGFAGVLGPTRGLVAKVGSSPLLLNLWGHIPHTPWEGACAPSTPFCPPPLAECLPAFWVPLVGGVANVGGSPPLLNLWGDTPHTPCHGGSAPLDPPFGPPSWA